MSAPQGPGDANEVRGGASPGAAGALRLSALRVRRMPGIPDGFTLAELSEGVTVVFGPNASGKSSTARAIEAALWPARASGDVSVVAEYEMDGSRFRVEVDAGHVAVQRDGADSRAPELPAPELRHRYRLSLHELIASDDGDFAKEIARQSAGGYDLAAASAALEFGAQASAARNESAAVARALDVERAARQSQRALGERAAGLDELRGRREVARAARERQQLLALAVKHARAVSQAESARALVAGFPPELGAMSGTEHERLGALRERSRECREEIERARREEVESLAAAARIFHDGAPDHATMSSLRARLGELRDLQQSEAGCARTLEACAARRADAWRAVAAGGTGAESQERLARIDAASFRELAGFAREAERAHAELAAADAAARMLAEERAPEDLYALRAGADVLSRWLAEVRAAGERAGRNAAAFLWGLALLAASGWLLHALRWHWAFALVALAAAAVALWGSRLAGGTDRVVALRHEYERLGLERPREWTTEMVRDLRNRVQARLAEGSVAAERAVLRAKAEKELALAEERARAVDARGRAVAERLGAAPDTDQRQLSWLAERIGQWQNAALDVTSAAAELDAARARLNESLAGAAEVLARFGEVPRQREASVASVAGAIDALERRCGDHAAALARAAEADRVAAASERLREGVEHDCEALLARVGVADDVDVEKLCASFESFRAACEAERFSRHSLDSLRAELRATAGHDEELECGAIAALERERDEAAAAAGDLDDLTAELARLEQEVEHAKRASDLESAVAATEGARAALASQRDGDLRAMIGDMIARHVQRLTRDKHRPEVFRRAHELFTLVTRGRYGLMLEDGAAPSFRAYDVDAAMGRALDQLSSATRVQLMLAVRVAFVESQERRAALPLLLDETLGTSDDVRARAIIDAVMLLARQGRQIFYFTAQHDEAGKWVAALEESGVPHAVVDLALARGESASPALAPLPIASAPLGEIPEPDGCSHADYGAMLRVPVFRPGSDAPDSVPLWYLMDEPDELCRIMRSGVRTWGELRNLVEHGAARLVEGCPALWRRARACAAALDALCHEAAIGLGRPVDRSVLARSRAVSDVQMEKVLAVCDRCDGDARALMEGIENGAVPGFHKRKAAELRAHLEEGGYLDERPRRGEAQLRAAMQRAIAPAVSDGDIVPAEVDALLRRLESRRSAVAAGPAPLAALEQRSAGGGAQAESRTASILEG